MAESVTNQIPVPELTTPLGAIHTHLDAIERLIDNPAPKSLEELLVTLDAAKSEIDIHDENYVETSEEGARWNTIVQTLRKRPQIISVPARGVPGGMAALRATHPEGKGFWWEADKMRAEQQRNQLIRALILLAIAALIMWGAGWLWSNYFTTDETALISTLFL